MEFKLVRLTSNASAVYGVLSIVEGDKKLFTCHTIENKKKIFPDGKYPVKFEHSPRFNTNLWELYGIPGRSEIKIHSANYWDQLDGCIGVGLNLQDINGDFISDITESRKTLSKIHFQMGDLKESAITVVTV